MDKAPHLLHGLSPIFELQAPCGVRACWCGCWSRTRDEGLSLERHGQNLALTVLHVPYDRHIQDSQGQILTVFARKRAAPPLQWNGVSGATWSAGVVVWTLIEYTLHRHVFHLDELVQFSKSTPYTLHPQPSTLHSAPYTLHSTPSTLSPTPCTLNPKPSS